MQRTNWWIIRKGREGKCLSKEEIHRHDWNFNSYHHIHPISWGSTHCLGTPGLAQANSDSVLVYPTLFSREILLKITQTTIPLPTRQGCGKAKQAGLWGGGTKTEVIKQPDLVLVQHRKESVSVTSHYRLREGWGRAYK